MACSRTPKCRFRPESVGVKSPAPAKVRRVLVEGVRSADPPSSHGTFLPMALSTSALVSRSEEHTSELQSHLNLVCRLLLEKKKTSIHRYRHNVPSRTAHYV